MTPVHLALRDVAACLAEAPDPARWLTGAEQARLAGLRSARRRDQFAAARWNARWLLAQCEGGAPAEWALTVGTDAPPAVAGRPALSLALSHSGGWVACAVSANGLVGLDVEAPERVRDLAGLATLCCTAREREAMHASHDFEAAFYTRWTAKEAWLKRRREWIAPSRLVQLETAVADARGELRCWRSGPCWVALDAPAGIEPRWWTPPPGEPTRWSVRDLEVRDLRPA